jgi:hypothetical protein
LNHASPFMGKSGVGKKIKNMRNCKAPPPTKEDP